MKTMYKLLLTLTFLFAAQTLMMAQNTEMEQDMFENMRDGDKAVVVAVHTGADDAATQQCIDRFNARLRQTYPNYAFKEAWTSHTTHRVPTPDELLSQLEKEGYTHVLVQSSHLIDNTEQQYLSYLTDANKGRFKHLRLGKPLLSDPSDYECAISIMNETYGKPKEVNVLVCNDTEGKTHPQYAMLDYALHDHGLKTWHVGTIDGYPSLGSLIKQLKAQKIKKVHLIPFMFATDAQTTAYITKDWVQQLQKAGYKVTANIHSLGELDAILDLFESHIRHAEKFRALTAKELKMLK
ncbi:MAG: sirohydrochlorin cobaltochelatase [Bacteroidaceae bacterium]|nr:sirohydrochlorin cobaltochelatase [Bacteroidaceae bacterium]